VAEFLRHLAYAIHRPSQRPSSSRIFLLCLSVRYRDRLSVAIPLVGLMIPVLSAAVQADSLIGVGRMGNYDDSMGCVPMVIEGYDPLSP
jgi:hypothetical protein